MMDARRVVRVTHIERQGCNGRQRRVERVGDSDCPSVAGAQLSIEAGDVCNCDDACCSCKREDGSIVTRKQGVGGCKSSVRPRGGELASCRTDRRILIHETVSSV